MTALDLTPTARCAALAPLVRAEQLEDDAAERLYASSCGAASSSRATAWRGG